MAEAQEITREQHLAATGGRRHDDESHHAWGAVCRWYIDGKTYQEHQPDIGRVRWFVSDCGHDHVNGIGDGKLQCQDCGAVIDRPVAPVL